MIWTVVEWWLILNMGFVAFWLGPAERRIRNHDNVLPFRR